VSGRRKRPRPAGRAATVSPRRRGSAGLAIAGIAIVAIAVLWISRAMARTSGPPPAAGAPTPPAAPPAALGPERLRIDVLAVHPHDPQAYTQGLVWHHGELYESDGLYGKSSLRRVDPATGTVRQQIAIEPRIFAEGLALVGEHLIQLTWREGLAPVYDRATFRHLADFHYEGEGWGLCYDGKRLVMSDGSDRLFFRDPQTFALEGSVAVTRDGVPVTQLNELECVGGEVWSNVWQTDDILRIDPQSGRVTGVAEATGLLTPEDRAGGAEVLNGIAYDPAAQRFWITGKLWPKMFEVRFAPAGR
jgi:glutaminyl-peptide cyclotransferase